MTTLPHGQRTLPQDDERPVMVEAAVVKNEGICDSLYSTVFFSPELASRIHPAQFLAIKVRPGPDPFLRRPFSVSMAGLPEGTVQIVWAKVGRGTELMTMWREGDLVNILGPLGNGFLPRSFGHLIIVAGGTGIGPVPFMIRRILEENPESRITLLYGARSRGGLYPPDRLPAGPNLSVIAATEDGSFGERGLVTDLLASRLAGLSTSDSGTGTGFTGRTGAVGSGARSEQPAGDGAGDVLAFACGPRPMLSVVKKLTRAAGVPLYVSLEERMGCGAGLCRGCAARASNRSERATSHYLHVCVDGPVFAAEEVDLEG